MAEPSFRLSKKAPGLQAVDSMEFGDELKIMALRSHEGELLYLHEPFNPTGA
jgi:hypothetical protein